VDEFEVDQEKLGAELRALLEKHGVVQNFHIRPMGEQFEVRAQLRPFNPNSSSEMEMAAYRNSDAEDDEPEEDESTNKEGFLGIRAGIRRFFRGGNGVK